MQMLSEREHFFRPVSQFFLHLLGQNKGEDKNNMICTVNKEFQTHGKADVYLMSLI